MAAHPVGAVGDQLGQVVEQVGHGHRGELGAGQLERERQPAAAPAQLGDERRGRLVDGQLAAAPRTRSASSRTWALAASSGQLP